MILTDHERHIVECEVSLIGSPQDAPVPTLLDHIKLLMQTAYTTNAYLVNKEQNSFHIKDIQIYDKENYIVLLIQHADSVASDPAFAKLDTGISRLTPKGEGEGCAVTAHVVIKTEAIDPLFPNQYLAFIEEVPGITRSYIARALTYFFRSIEGEFEKNDKKYKCRIIVDMQPYASETFENAFKNGHLVDIYARKNSTRKYMDHIGIPITETTKLDFKLKRTTGKRATDLIKKIIDVCKAKSYSRVTIVKESDGRTTSTEIDIKRDLNTKDLKLETFIIKKSLQLNNPISVCQNSIHSEFVEEIIQQNS